jgi:ATP-dependent RNA helicase SUPV3L1/SUV3
MKKLVETSTSFRAAVIYGSLPPEARTEQARLFNDPNSEYRILVASDAIGMGLNLYVLSFH